MCGIAGVLYADPARPVDAPLLRRMGDAIAHRGPDADGVFAAPGIGLAHRRLSIIDLAGGDQPISNEAGDVTVVFNGEIYNYRALRDELIGRGHRLRTASDTEVIVHLYEECGARLVERLRGMFAFALWDHTRRQLLLARDRIGIKPLYVYRDRDKLLFGSEIKAILAHPDVDRQLSLPAVEDYLAYGMVMAPACIFARMEKLPPAHTLTVAAGAIGARPQRYWQLRFETDERRSADEWQEAVRAKVAETVAAHLVADVPVGAFLSGGVDSSVVVAAAAPALSRPLQTFSIGFREQQFSELAHAGEVARAFNTDHETETATADAAALLDRFVHHYDEPFADSSAIPTLLVSRLASRRVKVALSGDGGDEAFGGYPRYATDLREAALRRRLPLWVRQEVCAPLASLWPQADWLPRPLRGRTLLTNLSLEAPEAYANSSAVCRMPLRRRLLSKDVVRRLNGHAVDGGFRQVYDRSGVAGDPLAGMIAADVALRLPDDYLVKVDRASMAFGLEVRPPFLDHELLELTARIPSRLKIRGGQTKWIFKEAYRDRLPAAVTARPKQGFEIPVDDWMRGPLAPLFEASVLGRSPLSPLVDTAAVADMFAAHRARRAKRGAVLWSLLVLAQWMQQYRPSW